MSKKTDKKDATLRTKLLKELVQLRKDKDLSQTVVAKGMGIGQPSVSELERGMTSPRVETLQRYARAIGAELVFTVKEVEDNG
jgi:transcriptional regulator with XRE-family HTH domain